MITSLHRPPGTPSPAVLLLGAGGHGQVVADAALLSTSLMRLTDANPQRWGADLFPGLRCCSLEEALGWMEANDAGVHVAIGANAVRDREIHAWAHRHGWTRLTTICHPTATISPHAVIAPACFVAARAVLGPGALVGMGCIINHGAVVDHGVRIGICAHVAPGAVLGGDVQLGDRVLIGAGAVLLPGVAVCSDVVVGAGAVVTTAISEPGTYVGIPARRMA